jgi:hypothetical protein
MSLHAPICRLPAVPVVALRSRTAALRTVPETHKRERGVARSTPADATVLPLSCNFDRTVETVQPLSPVRKPVTCGRLSIYGRRAVKRFLRVPASLILLKRERAGHPPLPKSFPIYWRTVDLVSVARGNGPCLLPIRSDSRAVGPESRGILRRKFRLNAEGKEA